MWSTETLKPLCILNPHLETDSGDIFCLAWNPTTSTIYFGCQNTSLQWFSFAEPSRKSDSTIQMPSAVHPPSLEQVLLESGFNSGTATPRRAHKFFDSYPQYERKPADLNARNPTCSTCSTPPTPPSSTPPGQLNDSSSSSSQGASYPRVLQVPPTNMVWSAHYGYVYCMALVPSLAEGSDDVPITPGDDIQLVTGSGDSSVKVFRSVTRLKNLLLKLLT